MERNVTSFLAALDKLRKIRNYLREEACKATLCISARIAQLLQR